MAKPEQRYSGSFKNNIKPNLLGNTPGLYNGNYGDRNSCFVNQNTLSLNIGGGTFNQSTKSKDTFLSKTVGSESFKNTHQIGSMRSKSTAEQIGNMKKSGPIKATISTEKVRMSKYEPMDAKYSETQAKRAQKSGSREKRPHSSTFIGPRDQDLYAKVMTTNPKPKVQKPGKENSKKKVNKRVRSASPAGLKNFLTQQKSTYAASKGKPQRIIGGDLYQPNVVGYSKFN